MKICRVRWTGYRVPFRSPYTSARGASLHREAIVLEVTADNGLAGLGEAVLMPETPEPLALLQAAMQLLAPNLINLEPHTWLATDDSDAAIMAVLAAIDVAICDLLASERGVSIANYLQAPARESVPVNALVTTPGPEASDAAHAAVSDGYRCIKLKVGMERSLQAERSRVGSVRDAIGPDVSLRIDPNGSWSVDQAIEYINELSQYGIEYVEQPIAEGRIEDLARVQANVTVPIAADEDISSLGAAQAIIEAKAAQVLILKPSRLGGIRPCLEIIRRASAAGIRSNVTTSIETGIGTAACLQLAACLPLDAPASGLSTGMLLETDLATPLLTPLDGLIRLPAAPGLGVRLSEAASPYLLGWQEAG